LAGRSASTPAPASGTKRMSVRMYAFMYMRC
jgi:hypothetical protein